MYPNPQDALPLPPHPSVEQYRKLAKDLVKGAIVKPDLLNWDGVRADTRMLGALTREVRPASNV